MRESFSGLEGSLHCTSKNISGISDVYDRDAVLYKILQYIDKPANADKVVGLNRMSKLNVKIGKDIKYKFLRNEW